MAHAPGVPEVRGEARAGRTTSRRRFLRGALFGGLGLAAVGTIAGVLDFLFPRAEWDALKRTHVGNVRDFALGGAPVRFSDGRGAASLMSDKTQGIFLVHLDGAQPENGGQHGLVALAEYCTHLGCTMPWRPDFSFENRVGWFRCGCHGATFTRGGVRVFGPAPRGMDYYPLAIDDDGNVYVDRTQINRAVPNQPPRATPLPEHLRAESSSAESRKGSPLG